MSVTQLVHIFWIDRGRSAVHEHSRIPFELYVMLHEGHWIGTSRLKIVFHVFDTVSSINIASDVLCPCHMLTLLQLFVRHTAVEHKGCPTLPDFELIV